MSFLVRRATVSDAEAIARVEVSGWRSAYAGMMPGVFLYSLNEEEKARLWHADIAKHAVSQRKRVLVATHETEVVGFVRVGPPSEHEAIGLVYLLYVLPAHWSCGCGTLLMEAAMEELVSMRLLEATLWVLRDNLRARSFYETAGWLPDGAVRTEDYGGVQLESWLYRRRLALRNNSD